MVKKVQDLIDALKIVVLKSKLMSVLMTYAQTDMVFQLLGYMIMMKQNYLIVICNCLLEKGRRKLKIGA